MNKDNWNDGYYIEALDRCHVIMVMIDEILNEHPAIERLGLQKSLDKAIEEIMHCYQTISAQEETWKDL